MATPRELADLLLSGTKKLATKAANAPTGVVPGYHAALGGTVDEAGRLRYVGSAPVLSTLARASLTGTITLTNGTFTRVTYDTVDYDPGERFAYDAVNDWIFLPGWPNLLTPATAWDEIGARVNIQSPAAGEYWASGDALTLAIYRYDSVGATSTLITVLDYHVVTASAGAFNYPVILHGTAMVPPVAANTQHYYIAVRNESRYDRVIVGSDGSSAFWAMPR